jgi:flagellar motor switch protein FliG
MFSFDDIQTLRSTEVQAFMKDPIITDELLGAALKGADKETVQYVGSNVGPGDFGTGQQDLLDAIEAANDADTEKAQQKVIEVILKLAATGDINLRPLDGGK